MSYHSVVCVKQVPDTANVTGEAMKEDGTINRAALPAIFNPEDLNALEAALAVRDEFGGTVTALTMGPLGATAVLRECLFRGADRAILISDRKAAASDTLATSYIISCAVRKIGDYDLVFCGRQAIDGDTAQVGPQLAEKLGIPQATYFEKLESLEGRSIRVRRNVGNGWEVVESPLPVLLTVPDSANVPRPAAVRRVMKCKRARTFDEVSRDVEIAMPDADAEARQAESAARFERLQASGLTIEQWNLEDLGADLQWCGMTGSPTWVHRIQSIVLTRGEHKSVEPTQEGVRDMVHELITDHTIG